jgi:hypothetical protein
MYTISRCAAHISNPRKCSQHTTQVSSIPASGIFTTSDSEFFTQFYRGGLEPEHNFTISDSDFFTQFYRGELEPEHRCLPKRVC